MNKDLEQAAEEKAEEYARFKFSKDFDEYKDCFIAGYQYANQQKESEEQKDAVSIAWTWLAKKGSIYGGIVNGDCFKAADVLKAIEIAVNFKPPLSTP